MLHAQPDGTAFDTGRSSPGCPDHRIPPRDRPTGGGTDAAYASLATKAPVIEGLGVRGYGAHSSDSEYVVVDAIAPKLVLVTRLVMAIGSGKAL